MGYNIGQQIGDRGGFGSVHICISETGEQYAIKLLGQHRTINAPLP